MLCDRFEPAHDWRVGRGGPNRIRCRSRGFPGDRRRCSQFRQFVVFPIPGSIPSTRGVPSTEMACWTRSRTHCVDCARIPFHLIRIGRRIPHRGRVTAHPEVVAGSDRSLDPAYWRPLILGDAATFRVASRPCALRLSLRCHQAQGLGFTAVVPVRNSAEDLIAFDAQVVEQL